MAEYEVVIGIEIHAQIATQSKLWCGCSNDSFGKSPNSNICPICTGHPGQLPQLNKLAVEKGIKAGLALKCKIPSFCKFDRKNYFYPDLPLGYQISQFDQPIAINGSITVEVGDTEKTVSIERLHLENDAGKLTHVSGGSLVDYNRSGAPLMEIVSGPDMRSSEEAVAYAKSIQSILRYVNSSYADMEKGMMRFDINVSLHKPNTPFGAKVEVKNLNSFKSMHKALEYEIKRQTDLLEKGETVAQETRGWHDISEVTISQRGKEDAHDYRYFPEPDIPPLHIDKSTVHEYQAALPELPFDRKKRLIKEYNIKAEDAELLANEKELGDFFEAATSQNTDLGPKTASIVLSVLLGMMKKEALSIDELGIEPHSITSLMQKQADGALSSSNVKLVIETMYEEKSNDIEGIIKAKNLVQISDSSEMDALCDEVLAENEQSVTDYKNGKDRAFGFLVGQVMKKSRGKANPQMVNKILKQKLTS